MVNKNNVASGKHLPDTLTKSPSKNLVWLGEITAPHGIRGAVRIRSFTQDPHSIFDYPELTDQQGRSYRLKFFAAKQNHVFVVTIQGINTCSAAEALRGIKLYVDRSQLPPVDEEEFYYEDLIGLSVTSTMGEEIGTVHQVYNHGAGEFLEIKASDHSILTIPFTKEAVPTISISERQLVVVIDFLLK